MSELINSSKRQLIPRWHTSRKMDFIRPIITSVDEFRGDKDDSAQFNIGEKKQAWEKSPTIISAVDLFVGLNLANMMFDPLFEKVKRYLLSQNEMVSPAVSNIISPKLKKLDESNNYTINKDQIYVIINLLKSFLKDNPNDSLTWNDLSFYYAVIGEELKSKHCMHVGFNLQAEHPFFARSYARLLVHYDEPDKAISILKKSNKIRPHPEILSADIAIRRAFNIGNANITSARHLIDIFSNRPQCISELSASLGTIEAENGSIKKAKNYLSISAIAPTENTMAQLKWISQQHKIIIPTDNISILSLEANAISSYNKKDYPHCRDELMMLHRFQPFSEGALVDAGYLSMVALDDPEFVCEISNYDALESFRAKNNYVASKLTVNDLSGSEKMLKDLGKIPKEDREIAVFTATFGMYLYRIGEIEGAKKQYEDANTFFKYSKDNFSLTLSLLYQGLVEKELGISGAKDKLLQAEKEAKKIIRSPELLDKIKRELITFK